MHPAEAEPLAPSAAAASEPQVSALARQLILWGALVTTVAGILGTAFLPYLLVEQPELLLVTSADARNLVLVASRVDLLTAALIVIPRRLLAMGVTYGMGLLYGPALLGWSARKLPRLARLLAGFQRLYARFGLVLVVLWPAYATSALAGITRTPFRAYFAWMSVGQVLFFLVIYFLGDAVSAWTDGLVAVLRDHLPESTAVCLALVGLQQTVSYVRRRAQAGRGEGAAAARGAD